MFFRLYFTAFYQQIATHAQMYHQIVILKLNIYILGAAADTFYHLTLICSLNFLAEGKASVRAQRKSASRMVLPTSSGCRLRAMVSTSGSSGMLISICETCYCARIFEPQRA